MSQHKANAMISVDSLEGAQSFFLLALNQKCVISCICVLPNAILKFYDLRAKCLINY